MISIAADDWKIERVGAVIFDKDGTLTDSHLYWGRIIEKRAQAIMTSLGLNGSIFEPLCLSMGYSVPQKKLIPEGPVALVGREWVITAVRDYLLSEEIKVEASFLGEIFTDVHKAFQSESEQYIRLLPGVRELLEGLKANQVKLGVVTSDSRENTLNALKYLKLIDYFSVVIVRESAAEDKESGIPARLALESMQVLPDVAITVGDAPVDIVMAEKTNMKAALAVTTGQVSNETLKKLTPYVVSNLQAVQVKT